MDDTLHRSEIEGRGVLYILERLRDRPDLFKSDHDFNLARQWLHLNITCLRNSLYMLTGPEEFDPDLVSLACRMIDSIKTTRGPHPLLDYLKKPVFIID
jgi:hypothetical protein